METEAIALVVLTMLSAQRRAKGAEWCEKRLVGEMRRSLGPMLPQHVRAVSELRVTPRGNARALASDMLRTHCRGCPFTHCGMHG